MYDGAISTVAHAVSQVVKHLLRFLAWMLLLHLLVFSITEILPSPEYGIAGWTGIDDAILRSTRERLGLSGSPIHRYFQHLSNLCHGDMGRTVNGAAAGPLFVARLGTSMPILLAAVVIVIVIPVPIALTLIIREAPPIPAWLLRSTYALLIPQFLACCLGQALYLHLPLDDLGLPAQFVKLALTVICITIGPAALLFLAAANTAASLRRTTFVQAHYAAGASSWRVRERLARNLYLSLLPLSARTILMLISGLVFAESLFTIDGIGALLMDAVRSGDSAITVTFVLFAGASVTAISMLRYFGHAA